MRACVCACVRGWRVCGGGDGERECRLPNGVTFPRQHHRVQLFWSQSRIFTVDDRGNICRTRPLKAFLTLFIYYFFCFSNYFFMLPLLLLLSPFSAYQWKCHKNSLTSSASSLLPFPAFSIVFFFFITVVLFSPRMLPRRSAYTGPWRFLPISQVWFSQSQSEVTK